MDQKAWIAVATTEHMGSDLLRERRYTSFWMAPARLRSRKSLLPGRDRLSQSVVLTWPSGEQLFPLLNPDAEVAASDGETIQVLISTETRPGAHNTAAALLAYEVAPGVWVPNTNK